MTTVAPTEKNSRVPCKKLSVKEYFGWPDIQKNRDTILDAYKAMPRVCTNLMSYGSRLEDHFERVNPDTSYILLVTENGDIVGFAMATLVPKDNSLCIDHLCTNQTCRGAGREIMNRMTYIALQYRYNTIRLIPAKSAIPFYKRLGFVDDPSPGYSKKYVHLAPMYMRLDVLLYFLCYVKSRMSPNDMVSLNRFFRQTKTRGVKRKRHVRVKRQ